MVNFSFAHMQYYVTRMSTLRAGEI